MTMMDSSANGAARFGFVARMAAAVLQWRDAEAVREQLSHLTDRELDDIGLSRGDIRRISRSR